MDDEKNIIGIKKEEIFLKKNGKIARPGAEPFWEQLVAKWFQVYGELVPTIKGNKAVPIFRGAEPKHMKILVATLRCRATTSGVEWTEKNALQRWEAFLKNAFKDDFISKNFMLRIISNNATKIFNNQITVKNGSAANFRSAKTSPVVTTKPKGGFGKL